MEEGRLRSEKIYKIFWHNEIRFSFRYLLVDFGLAQQYTSEDLKTIKEISIGHSEIQPMKRKRSDEVKYWIVRKVRVVFKVILE